MEVKTLDRTQPTAKSKRLSFLNRNKRNVLIHILPASKSGTKSTPTRWMHMPLQHEKTVFIGGARRYYTIQRLHPNLYADL